MLPVTSQELDAALACVYGDPWAGLGPCSVRENGEPPTIALDSVTLEFALNTPGSAPLLTVAVPITSAANWEFTDAQAVYTALGPNVYSWKLRLVDVAGTPQTFMVGTWKVEP